MGIDNVNEIREFKKKMQEGCVIGPFSKTSDPAIIEIIGHAGFDFIIIDLEHGPNSVQTLQNLIRAAQLTGVLPIVRAKEDVRSVISEVLDIGASGVQVPQVESAADAMEIVKLAKFHPLGMRGVCRFVRAADYSAKDRYEYFKEANEALVIIQLEGKEAIDNIESIIEVDGIDVIFIGPYDLSQSLGIAGQIDHPMVERKMVQIIDVCLKNGKTVGTFVDTVENAQKWKAMGIKYIAYSVDVGIFFEGARGIVERIG